MPKRKTLSAQEVVDELMQWVEDGNPDDGEIEEDNDNLDELNGKDADDDDDVEDNVNPDDVTSDEYVSEGDVQPAGHVRQKYQRKNSRTNAIFTALIQLSMRTITTCMLHPYRQSQSLLIFSIHQIQARNENYPFKFLLRSLLWSTATVRRVAEFARLIICGNSPCNNS